MKVTPNNEESAERARAEALDWFVKRRETLPQADEASFQTWLHASSLNAEAYARWEQQWQKFDTISAAAVAKLRDGLARDKVKEVQAQQRTSNLEHSSLIDKTYSHAWKVGAVLATLVIAVFSWSYWWQPVFTQSYVTAKGEQGSIELPDGSRILLDASSRMEVALYRGHREVSLPSGQAQFSVKSEADRPFRVEAGPLQITVVGTTFAVRYTPELPGGDGVRVAVEEGRVRVEGASQVLELTDGQQVSSDGRGQLGAMVAVNSYGIAPWRHGRVSFDNAPLKQVIAEFERYGDIRVSISDPELAELRLTGTFDLRQSDNFFRVLPQVLPVQISETKDGIEIKPLR